VLTRQTSYTLGKLELFEGSLGRGDEDVGQFRTEIKLVFSVENEKNDKSTNAQNSEQDHSDVLAVAQERAQSTHDFPKDRWEEQKEIEQISDSNDSLSHGVLTHQRLSHSVTTHIKSAKFAANFIMKFPIHKIDFERFRVE